MIEHPINVLKDYTPNDDHDDDDDLSCDEKTKTEQIIQ